MPFLCTDAHNQHMEYFSPFEKQNTGEVYLPCVDNITSYSFAGPLAQQPVPTISSFFTPLSRTVIRFFIRPSSSMALETSMRPKKIFHAMFQSF